MREIKFRAWDKANGKMITSPLVLHLSGAIEYPEGGWDVHGHDDSLSYHLMQYTGLKDRDGVEIVIGDILLLDLLSGDRYSSVRLCPVREIPTVCFFEEDDFEPLFCYVGKPDTCLRVVGNIYENPELLHNERAV